MRRAEWAYLTGQPWTTYDDLTEADLTAWDAVIDAARKRS